MKSAGVRVLVLVACATVLASCSGGTPPAQPAGSTGGAASTNATPSTTRVPLSTTVVTPATTATPGSTLTGIGATIAAYRSAHFQDLNPANCPVTNPCFGPIVLNAESGTTYQFTDVVSHGGLVVAYGQNFPSNTSAASAEAYVLRFMPLDARMGPVTIDAHGGTCALYNITSPTLAAAFDAHPGSGNALGTVGVELSFTTIAAKITFDPNNVEDAFVSVAPVMPNSSC